MLRAGKTIGSKSLNSLSCMLFGKIRKVEVVFHSLRHGCLRFMEAQGIRVLSLLVCFNQCQYNQSLARTFAHNKWMLILLAHIFKTWSLHSQINLWMLQTRSTPTEESVFHAALYFVLCCYAQELTWHTLNCSVLWARSNETMKPHTMPRLDRSPMRTLGGRCFFFSTVGSWCLFLLNDHFDMLHFIADFREQMVEFHLHLPSVSTTC